MAECIAVVNAGSSSVKFAFYDSGRRSAIAVEAGRSNRLAWPPAFQRAARTGEEVASLGRSRQEDRPCTARWGRSCEVGARAACRIDGHARRPPRRPWRHRLRRAGRGDRAEIIARSSETLSPLAPLHQPHNLGPIRADVAQNRPDVRQVACFDTAFHPVTARILPRPMPLPRELCDSGIEALRLPWPLL